MVPDVDAAILTDIWPPKASGKHSHPSDGHPTLAPTTCQTHSRCKHYVTSRHILILLVKVYVLTFRPIWNKEIFRALKTLRHHIKTMADGPNKLLVTLSSSYACMSMCSEVVCMHVICACQWCLFLKFWSLKTTLFPNAATSSHICFIKALCGTVWLSACMHDELFWHSVGNSVGWPSDVCECFPKVFCGHLSDDKVFEKFFWSHQFDGQTH